MIFDLHFLQIFCWILIGTALSILSITMGFDLGVGTLLHLVGRTDEERRVAINVIGPTWDGNQVWLIFGGGAFFACWPLVYSTAFSGLYIAMLLLLWSLFLRPLAFEYRSKIDNPTWRKCWDWGLFTGSITPALIFGIAFGNLFLGMPFHFEIDFGIRSFYTGNFFDLFSPFALLAGIISITMFVIHGGAMLQLRTRGVIQQRARTFTQLGSLLFILLFAIGGFWITYGITGYQIISQAAQPLIHPFSSDIIRVTGAWVHNYRLYPWMMMAPFIAFMGAAIAMTASSLKRPWLAFLGSTLTVSGTVATAGLSLFPFLMPSSTVFRDSLTIWNATSSYYSLATFSIAVSIFLPFVLFYTLWVYKKLWRRIDEQSFHEKGHHFY